MSLSEFDVVNFGDNRLKKRGQKILNSLFDKSSLSLNGSFNGWKEAKAAYRFFSNNKVTLEKILEPHKIASLKRIEKEEVILCVQDTTIVDYTHRKEQVKGLGMLRTEHEQGLLLHPTIAFAADGLCLGVLGNKIWIRDKLLGKELRNKTKPIEEKESYRWIESYSIMQEIAANYPNKLFFNITDREGDFYELLEKYNSEKNPNAHLLVRAKSDRTTKDAEDNNQKLWEEVSKEKVLCNLEFETSSIRKHKNKKKLREGRKVQQEVRIKEVNIMPPQKAKKFKLSKPIKLTAILCSEINPPSEEEKIEWLLLSTFSVSDETEARELIQYYVLRWQIEIFFKILKSGCKIEELQLETRERIEKCLGMYMIVAWRILFLSCLGRNTPDLPCNLFYDDNEWKAVYIIFYKKIPPDIPPSINIINRIIASFGGFLNRKGDGEPGAKTMWIGLQRLRDFTLAYEIFQNRNICG